MKLIAVISSPAQDDVIEKILKERQELASNSLEANVPARPVLSKKLIDRHPGRICAVGARVEMPDVAPYSRKSPYSVRRRRSTRDFAR